MTYGTHLNFRETSRMLIGRGRPAGRDEKEAICSREEGKGGVAQGSSLIEKALIPVSLLLQLSVDGGRGIRKRSEERAINIQAAEDKTRTTASYRSEAGLEDGGVDEDSQNKRLRGRERCKEGRMMANGAVARICP